MANSDKNIRITTSKNKTTFPNIVFTGSSAGTSVLTLEVRDDNTVAFTGSDGDVFSLDYNLSTGTIWSVNDKSGTPFLRASAGGTIGIAEFGSGVQVGIGQTNPRYKLDVQGWVGFASTGDGSYTALFENGLTTGNNAFSIRASNSLRLYNSDNSFYTAFKANAASANRTYVLPPTFPSTGTSVLQSDTSGNMLWAAMASGSSSGTVNSGTAGSVAIYPANGTAVSGTNILTVVGSGVTVGGLVSASSTTSAALVVLGGMGLTGNAFIGGTTSITNNTSSFATNAGALVVTGGLGLVGNAFIGGTTVHVNNTSSFGTNSGSATFAGGLGIVGNAFIGGTVNIINTTATGSTIAGALVVAGGVAIGQSVSVGGRLQLFNGANYAAFLFSGSSNATYTLPLATPSIGTSVLQSDTSGNMLWVAMSSGSSSGTVNSGTAGSVAYYSANGTAVSGSNILTIVGAGVTVGGLVSASSTTSAALVVLGGFGLTGNAFIGGTTTITNNTSSFATNAGALSITGGLGLVGNAFIGGTVNIINTSASGGTNSGALVVTGGVAIGQTLNVGGRINIFNGANYTGFLYSGSANATYTLPVNVPQSAVGTSVLASATDGSMRWVGLPAGGSASPGGSDTQLQYNSAGNFAGATGMTWENNTYLLQLNSLNQTTAIAVGLRLENGSSTSGLQNTRWSPALEFVARNGITNQYRNRFTAEVVPSAPDDYRAALRFKYSLDTGTATFSNNLFLIHSTFGIGIGASNTSFNNAIYFRAPSNLATDHQYVLPLLQPSAGGFGSSVLSSDTSGNLTWVPIAGGTGSGTVNSGTGGSFAVYLSTGSAVNGSSLITFTGSGVTIGSNVNASSITSGALTVYGGIAITGNSFIGGTTTITNSTASLGNNSGALVVSGGAAIGGTLNVGNMVKVGSLNYAATNVLGAFSSSVNSFNQLIIQNTNNGTLASADIVVSNDQSSDTAFYGNFGMNSSGFSGAGALNAPNAIYLSGTSGPLVLGTTTANPIRFTINNGATDVLYISESGTAISCFTNFGMRSQNDLRFWNSGNTFYGAIQGGNYTANYILTMPTAVGSGFSVMMTDSSGQLYFVAAGAGIAFSANNANVATIRQKRAITMQFCAGYTPVAAGADTVILKVPDSASDGVTDITYILREIDIRVETPSAGSSRIQLEKYSGTTAFTLGSTGSSMIAGLGITLTGAGTYFTSTNSFVSGSLVTSNDKLRLSWTLLNATHANFSIQLSMEEV